MGISAKRYFISQYTDGPATRWNIIDRQTQEWIRRFSIEAEAQAHADKLNQGPDMTKLGKSKA